MHRVLLAELGARGVRVESHEAVAIAQQLIDGGAVAPSPNNVRLGADGTVECVGCDTTPGVYEMGIFLQTLLPPSAAGVPGGLRYTIARALHEVEARPFDAIGDLARALARFERGERRTIIALLVRRLAPSANRVVLFPPAPVVARAKVVPAIVALPDDPHAAAAPSTALAFADPDELAAPEIALSPLRPHHTRQLPAALAVAAALTMCALGGFAAMRMLTAPHHTAAARQTAAHDGRAIPSRSDTATASTPAPAEAAPVDAAASTKAETATRARESIKAAPRRERRIERAQSNGDDSLVAAIDAERRPVFSPAFASNGSAMFLHAGSLRDARGAVAVSNTGAYDLQVMTIVDDGAHNYHVQPSPDGRTIAFDSDRDGERGIYLARRDGNDVRRISGDGYAAVPSWSPDGRRIAYIRAEAADPKVWNLWIQSLDDGRETRLTNYRVGQTWSASWFPDGRRICYAHGDTLAIVDLDSGRQEMYVSPVKGRVVRTPAVSPDGTKVIFQVFQQGAWMLNLASGSMQYVLTDPTAEEFAWSPDGRHVAFHSRRDGTWGFYVIAG